MTPTVVVDPTRVQFIAPRALLVDVNIRDDLQITPAFVDSLTRHGVLQPLQGVLTDEGQVRVRRGHHRAVGAVAANLPVVPIVVFADERTTHAAQVERLLTQLDENEQRTARSGAANEPGWWRNWPPSG
ncbi:MAG TPA: ParB N-terminal domain-containing protein [Kineosporiaceae bacterium]